MHKTLMLRLSVGVALMAACFALPAAAQQAYPSRPITVIVPYGPGTGIDLIARILTQKLAEDYKQGVVVKNLPGASGNIGAEAAAIAAPDGYTIAVIANSHFINQYLGKNVRDATKDLMPIAPVGTLPYLFGVPVSFPAKTIQDVVNLAKAKPGEINFAGLPGAVPHFLGVMLQTAGNIDIRMVSYKSTTDAISDVMSARVPLWFTTLPSAVSFVNTGRIRALAVSGSRRSPVLPNVPTMTESGFPQMDIGSSTYVVAPVGTPAAIINKLNADITRAMGNAEVIEKLHGQGLDITTSTPAELGEAMRTELAKWGPIVKASGLKPE